VRRGIGEPVVLLHGWPGFWYDWRHVIPPLAETADVIALDFRGFGDSDRPDLPPAAAYTPDVFARDVLALLDHLGLEQVVVAAHDLGATVAQTLARTAPGRIRSLALFNPPYPGIGARRFEPAAQREFWYQHFHQLPLAEKLVGYTPETVRLYLEHFYTHWAGRKDALRPEEFEAVADVYARPGAFGASIQYYRARAGARQGEAAPEAAALRVEQPTVVVWGEADPVIPVAWSDRLGEFFPNSTLTTLPGVGHFLPWEAPEAALEAIRGALVRGSKE
jgi:pimeloyl-ACP methyl ester carboxylesterase